MSRGRIVRWMLEEVGQPYRTELLEYGTSMKAPAYLAINPMGKVPALRHGEAVITEAGAICAYLADAFPQAGLAPPPGDRLRGPYFRWLFFAAGPIDAAFSNTRIGVAVGPEQRSILGYGSLEAALDAIEGAVRDRSYVVGDRFTAADLYLAAAIGYGEKMGLITGRPVLHAYAERLLARPAAVRAAGLDDAPALPQRSAA
jgi:glutathione S-transferase